MKKFEKLYQNQVTELNSVNDLMFLKLINNNQLFLREKFMLDLVQGENNIMYEQQTAVVHCLICNIKFV